MSQARNSRRSQVGAAVAVVGVVMVMIVALLVVVVLVVIVWSFLHWTIVVCLFPRFPRPSRAVALCCANLVVSSPSRRRPKSFFFL